MVTIAVPHKGRSLEQVLGRFVEVGSLPNSDKEYMCEVVSQDKERIKGEEEQIQNGSKNEYSQITEVDILLQSRQKENKLAHSLSVEYDFHIRNELFRFAISGLKKWRVSTNSNHRTPLRFKRTHLVHRV